MASRPRRNLRITLLPRLAHLARRIPPSTVLALRPGVVAALSSVPGWRARVERSMAAALGSVEQRRAHVRGYFQHLADLFAFVAIVNRCGVDHPAVASRCEIDPEGQARFRHALAGGKGALMVCPHLIGHEVMAGLAARELPITVLVRRSPDAEYEAVKQAWYAALGVEVVYRPPRGSEFQALGEMTAALRSLRKNRVLALTPDLLQRPGTGIPVRLFGRTAELPAGPFFLAVRTGAPLIACFFHLREGHYRLWSHPPLIVPVDEDRDAAVAVLAQEWAALFEAFVREHPDMWQFWLDKRWARWLDGP